MFDKVVTPSDVGKLNRLVIPKQSAEKFFPLKPSAAADNKGTQLTFEDPTGKPWRFRYSYWKSSRSYVMTRGWSSFVREKRLKTGDTVSFWGRRGKFFISWQCRRPCHRPPHPLPSSSASIHPMSNLRSSTFRSVGSLPNARIRVCGCGDDTGVVKQLRLFGVNIERFEPAKCEEAPEVGISNVSLAQVAKGLVVDIRNSSSKPSCFTFPAGSMLPFSQKK